jgi:lipopolysaccharide transport system permease protein
MTHIQPHALTTEVRKDRLRTELKATQGRLRMNFRELWAYRDLYFILSGRDVKLRYKQTALGVAWVVLQPVLTALIFTAIFGRVAHLPSDGVPYTLFVFVGLLPWTLFAASLQRAGNSLVSNANLISKVYFPRMIVPLAANGAVLVDFAVSLGVLAIMMAVYRVAPTWNLLALPFFLLLTLAAAIGMSLFFSALNVYYRDFAFALPFIIQIWTYVSPVAYATSLVPARWRPLFWLNPAVGFIEGFRWSLLGTGTFNLQLTLISAASATLFLVIGMWVFRRVERRFADVI